MSVVNIIVNWYSKLSIVVRWNGNDSIPHTVLSSVRQGGVLSPVLFNAYFNCMLSNLRSLDYGCHVKNMFIGAIGYADGLLLISAGIMQLESMLDSCGATGREIGIKFNSINSACICNGPNKYDNIAPMTINGAEPQCGGRPRSNILG